VSAEKIIIENQNIVTLKTPEVITEKSTSGRVDINVLLTRVREEKKKEQKVNLIFLGLFTSLIFIVGIILSF
jgi:hypothetical protein|tara:strand:- start:487 stop:702 length:216 start_codon:yes stop_codon:yes gene_type:complete